ncbi:hypothetical protein BGX23_006776 [Mortierella sp. AD031]|nr:hypothetical protein BGX23_006776 [Mortierella sp. AD031]
MVVEQLVARIDAQLGGRTASTGISNKKPCLLIDEASMISSFLLEIIQASTDLYGSGLFNNTVIAEWGDIKSWTSHLCCNKQARQDCSTPEIAVKRYLVNLHKVDELAIRIDANWETITDATRYDPFPQPHMGAAPKTSF